MARFDIETFETGNLRVKFEVQKAADSRELAGHHKDWRSYPYQVISKVVSVEFKENDENVDGSEPSWVSLDEIDIAVLLAELAAQDAQVAMLKQEKHRDEVVDTHLSILKELAMLPKIQKAADTAGLEVNEWIAETLVSAADGNHFQVSIDPDIHKRLTVVANGRSISLRELCTGVDFTTILHQMLVNRYI